ncbi:MAG: metal-dependent hydrolase, partial [Bacteroidota bacterium]
MDSLTQIVLGAACGEVVLGKKVGNRAMMWGAVGGTIPDMDVLANFMLTDMQALAFHRGISHSLFFATTVPFLVGYLVDKLYQSGLYQHKSYKGAVFLLTAIFTAFCVFVLNLATKIIGGSYNYFLIAITAAVGIWLIYRLSQNYLTKTLEPIAATRKDWTWLFFWSIFTHPLLDAFTAYGTQLFAPFSNYRVAFNNNYVAYKIKTVAIFSFIIGCSFFCRKT